MTNQSGVHRGYFGMREVEAVNERLDELLRREGINLSAFYTCPHGPDTGCECRKPGPGLGRQAADELGLDLSRSIVIGDKESDVGLGVALGARTILLAECGTDSCADLIVPDWKSLVREVEPWLASAADGKHMAVSV